MSYTDEEVILDRQTLIGFAEHGGGSEDIFLGFLERRKLRSKTYCLFYFNCAVVFDNGRELIKYDGPYVIELDPNTDFVTPGQTPFQHCTIKFHYSPPF